MTRFHVWFFLFCYLICALEVLIVSERWIFHFLIYFYCVLTPGLIFYAIAAHRDFIEW